MRKRETEHVGAVVEEYIEALKLRGKMNQFHARNSWDEMMGPMVAQATTKIFFKNKTLFVYINSSVLKSELMMVKTKIKDMLNKKVGAQVVGDIIFR